MNRLDRYVRITATSAFLLGCAILLGSLFILLIFEP